MEVVAAHQQFQVYHQQQVIKTLEIKGLYQRAELELEEYVKLVEAEAISETRRSWAKNSPPISA